MLAERGAIERVYHLHRTGTKLPFDQAMPPALLERLLIADQRKEAALRKVYAVDVTQDAVEAEVRRIEASTRAPEMLAEIKRALGDDPARFANVMARPIVVERILRQRFENDDALHAAERASAERARQLLVTKQPVADMREMTWQLGPRPPGGSPSGSAIMPAPSQAASSASGSYTNEATVQEARPLGGNERPAEPPKLYFEDLDPGLQQVLRIQLREPGDVSAVIETPAAFLVFLTKGKSATELTASCLTVLKRGYDEWLASLTL